MTRSLLRFVNMSSPCIVLEHPRKNYKIMEDTEYGMTRQVLKYHKQVFSMFPLEMTPGNKILIWQAPIKCLVQTGSPQPYHKESQSSHYRYTKRNMFFKFIYLLKLKKLFKIPPIYPLPQREIY